MEIEEGQKSPASTSNAIAPSYRSDVQDFLRETGYLLRTLNLRTLERCVRSRHLVGYCRAVGRICDNFQPGDADEWIESDDKENTPSAFGLREFNGARIL